jgi:hypothetical protein
MKRVKEEVKYMEDQHINENIRIKMKETGGGV